MADIHNKEKGYDSGSSDTASSEGLQIFERPTGIRGFYYHPMTQVGILGFVCFMCPGLYNALNGLGGGGQLNNTTAANASAAHYSTFAFSSFFAGSVNNRLGSRLTLSIGACGYCLYTSSLLAFNIHPGLGNFVITAGALHGICSGLLWAAQGSLMMSYPTEGQKGRFVAIFWTIFNLGGVVGASVTLGQNFHSTANSVGNSTYIAFVCLTFTGIVLPTIMADPRKMIRTDGTKVTAVRHPSWKTEFKGLWYTLRGDPMIMLLFPMFFASNWFYTWQFNDYNGTLFNIRARALNNLVYWIAQIFGSVAFGFLLDQKRYSRRLRAWFGWVGLIVFVCFTHVWAYEYQKTYTRASAPPTASRMDIYDSGYPAKIVLYMFFGFLDSIWQTTAYWLIGAMCNDPAKLAHFAGFYKSLQSAGAAGVWRADAVHLPFMNIFISTWSLLAAGLLLAAPMIHLRVKDTTDLADETLARMDDAGHIRPVEEVVAEVRGGGKQ